MSLAGARKAASMVMLIGAFASGWQARAMWAHMGASRQQAAVVRTVERQTEASRKVDEEHLETQERVRTVTRTLLREVPNALPPEAVERCTVPDGFVRLHDAAAEGVSAISDPAGSPPEAPSGVGLDQVAGVIVDNYGACHETRTQTLALQAWIRAQEDASR